MDPTSDPDIEAASSAEIERDLVKIDAGTVEFDSWMCSLRIVRRGLNGETEGIKSETVETLEAAALQLTQADRAILGERLLALLDAEPEVRKPGQRKSSVRNLKLNMELSLYFLVPKQSPN